MSRDERGAERGPAAVDWLVDGLNVIGTRPDGWWRDRAGAMRRLVNELGAYARRTGEEVTVVFDGRPVEPPAQTDAGVTALFASRRGPGAADDEIVRLAERLGLPTVVTSDRELARRVGELGAPVEPARAFRRRLEEQEGEQGS